MCGLFTFQILMSVSQRLAMEEVLAGTKCMVMNVNVKVDILERTVKQVKGWT